MENLLKRTFLQTSFSKAKLSMTPIQLRLLFIQTRPTPNPSSLKFLPGRPLLPSSDQTFDFPSIRYTHISPLARRLFQLEGVTRVFLGKDFISVTKKEDLDWAIIKPEVLEVITDHLTKNQPIVDEEA